MAREYSTPRITAKVLREIVICFVENDDDVLGKPVEKTIELRRGDERTGWIVGIRNVNNSRMLINGSRNRIQVESVI